ncbi:MAG: hypothetical protein ACKO32_11475, partial [Planctomycetia bacterium]
MSTKKRVYDIAKEYGMTGQDLAKHLRDRGMTQIKGHMASLDDFLVLQIEGMLEAEGRTRVQVRGSEESAEGSGGLVLKKKKKKPLGEAAGGDAPLPTEVPESAAVEPEIPSAPPQPVAAQPEPLVSHEVEPVPAPAKQVPPMPSPIEEVAVAEFTPEPAPEPMPAAPAAQPAVVIAQAQPEAPEVSAPADAAAPSAVPSAPTAPAAPEARKAGGKVLGFIDLSKLKST